MQIKNTIPIGQLLEQLPADSITLHDAHILRCTKDFLKNLRTEPEPRGEQFLFTQDVRMSLALELNDALAQIIKARIPRQRANAKVKLNEEERTELQAIKRSALEMREALEKFERICIDTAGFEVIGTFSDGERRRAKLEGGLPYVAEALHTLKTTRCRYVHLWEQMKGMEEYWTALNASCERWIAAAPQAPARGKAAGVHKGKALAAWLEACKKLGRDIAEELRNLK